MSAEPKKLTDELEMEKKEQSEKSQKIIQPPPSATSSFLPLFSLSDAKSKRALLEPQRSFIHFNLNLSETEQSAWAGLRVEKQPPQLNLYGDLIDLLVLVKKLLQDAGNSDSISDIVARSVDRLVNEMVSQFSAETAWICMRMSPKDNFFDVPRWHVDGYYTEPHVGEQHKIVMALKGRHTLFYNLPLHYRNQFMTLQRAAVDAYDINHRTKVAQLIDTAKIDSPIPPVGTIFIAGAEHGAVHSEPPFDSDRIFLSIFPCSFKQAEEMKKTNEEAEMTMKATNPKSKKSLKLQHIPDQIKLTKKYFEEINHAKRLTPPAPIPHPLTFMRTRQSEIFNQKWVNEYKGQNQLSNRKNDGYGPGVIDTP